MGNGTNSPVCTRTFSTLAGAEGRDAHLDVEHGPVVQCLRPHLCFSWAKDGDKDLGESVGDHRRAVRGALLGEVYGDVAELVLLAPVRTEAAIVENFYS